MLGLGLGRGQAIARHAEALRFFFFLFWFWAGRDWDLATVVGVFWVFFGWKSSGVLAFGGFLNIS